MIARLLARVIPVAPVRRLSRRVSAFRPLVWLVCVARDRSLAYRRAHRFALGGGVVLCDRYPHPQLASMDVPRIPTMPGGNSQNRIVKKMVALEERYHRTILPPDLLVVLRVDPQSLRPRSLFLKATSGNVTASITQQVRNETPTSDSDTIASGIEGTKISIAGTSPVDVNLSCFGSCSVQILP